MRSTSDTLASKEYTRHCMQSSDELWRGGKFTPQLCGSADSSATAAMVLVFFNEKT